MTDRIGVAVIGAGDGKQTLDFVFTTGGPDPPMELGPARAVNGVTRRLSSIEAAGQQLGWKPEVDLHSGLRELVAWWRSERSEGVGS